MKCLFQPGCWSMEGLTHAYSVRFPVMPEFAQREDYIENVQTPVSRDGYAYVSLLTKEKLHPGVKLSTRCAFEGTAAPLVVLAKALEEKEGKYDPAKHATRLSVILDRWEELVSIIEELPSAAEVENILRSVGCPLTVEEIGLESALLPMTLKASKDIRDKYVLSRLLWDLGLLDDFSERICEM